MASALKNLFSGRPTFHNPIYGESLYELARKATTRQIDLPDEVLNQQIVHMINEERATPMAAADSVAILKKRLNMEHPQKQFLSVVLTAKVLREAGAAVGPYTEELLTEVARVAARPSYNSPQAMRAKQAAMEVLRDYGRLGHDAFRQAVAAPPPYARPGYAPGVPLGAAPPGPPGAAPQQRDPASLAAERQSLLDEIVRMVHQAHGSCEIVNEILVAESDAPGAAGAGGAGVGGVGGEEAKAEFERDMVEQLSGDLTALRDSFNSYLEQLGGLQGPDAEEVMAKALDAVDLLDRTLAKASEAQEKRLLAPRTPAAAAAAPQPPAPALAEPTPTAANGAGAAAGAAAATAAAAAAAAAVTERAKSLNLIDFDDTPLPAAPSVAASAAPATQDPFALGSPTGSIAAPATAAAAPPASAPAADDSDPFAVLAATSSGGAPPAPAATAAPTAAAADPFADATPAWGAPSAAVPAPGPGVAAPLPISTAAPSPALSPAAAAATAGLTHIDLPGSPLSSTLQPPAGQPQQQPQQHQAYPGHQPYPSAQPWGAPTGYNPQQPVPYGYGGYAVQPTGGYMPQYTGGYPMQPQYTGGYMQPPGGAYMAQPTGGYPGMIPQQQPGAYGGYPGAAPYGQPQQQQHQQQQQQQQPLNPFGGGLSSGNPFAAPAPAAAAPTPAGGAGGAAPAGGSNPFGGQQQQVDSEWDRLFAKK
ncbi:hypothetical protein MNEG_8398 [Monoraphidium neglectum]|uniref:VHS domain-containing protein n=1 Tax=Monoraphidium neglectum TaxID=145388 RepID=A0A0D2KW36_9CHLO|nr:hypothetical protein MNEG_8398 [Monoraphidium neglectum]KIY99563.1 hypothetical protein MNEG_8398 [Monoraphidium neglectum]|eukprot:XP_013898583.1 hypothetical protein MNEG_8398 [Monoraphidium neglectum]